MSQANNEMMNEKKDGKSPFFIRKYVPSFALVCSLISLGLTYTNYEMGKHNHEVAMEHLKAVQAKIDSEETSVGLNDVRDINYNGTVAGFLELIHNKTGMQLFIDAPSETLKANFEKTQFIFYQGTYKEALKAIAKQNDGVVIEFYQNNAALIKIQG